MRNEEIFQFILGHFTVIKIVNGVAYCICPGHKDDKTSLHISMGDKKIILDCKANCSYRDILTAVGLKPEQLYYDYYNRPEHTKRVSKKQYWLEKYSQCRYDYQNISTGEYTHTKYRIVDRDGKKQFPQGHYNDDNVWSDGLKEVDTSLSVFCNGHIKQLQQAIQNGELICYTEGEKDCLTLWKYGYITFTCGAVRTFKQEIVPYLKGANIIVFGDNDPPGRADADRIAGMINTVGRARVIISPDVPEKGDITDYMSNHTKEDLQRLIAENAAVTDTIVGSPTSVADATVLKGTLVNQLVRLDAANKFPLTDIGSAMLFSAVFKNKHRYNVTAKDWFFYDGQRWILDREGLRARKSAKELSKALSIYAVNCLPDEGKERYLKYSLTWTYSRTRNAIIQDSRDLNFISNEELDADDYVLNLQNCVLVFHEDKVEKHEHSADLLLSKIANAEYHPGARCERWEQFLDEVMQGDKDKIHYLQKLFGTCLTGDVRLEKMWFLFGNTTRNGKSTMIERIADVLGDYSKTIRPETLAIKNNPDSRTASPDVAKLAGTRLCVCSEIPKRMPLDVGLLKTLTGRDTIVARFLHQDEFQFVPKFKMICNTNFLPVVSDNTIFKSDRIQVVSFDRHFEEAEQDKTLKDKLSTNEALSGILNWMIEGWIAFCREGLEVPEAIKKSTTDYESSSDKLQNFINECLAEAEGKNISVKETYARYEKWCSENGYHVENKQNFISDCKAKGIYKERGMVDGSQVRNIIKDYEFAEDGFVEVDGKTPFK